MTFTNKHLAGLFDSLGSRCRFSRPAFIYVLLLDVSFSCFELAYLRLKTKRLRRKGFDAISKVFSILSFWLCIVSFCYSSSRKLTLPGGFLRYSELATSSRTVYTLGYTRQKNVKIFFSLQVLLILPCLLLSISTFLALFTAIEHTFTSRSGITNLAAVERLKKSAMSIVFFFCLFLLHTLS